MSGYRRVIDDEDDGPSADDLARFGHESAYCPHCAAEVWDDAQQCPECGKWMAAGAARTPGTRRFRQIVGFVLIGLALAAFLLLSLCSVG